MSVTTKAPVLLVVLEYGELPELLRVAEVAGAALQTQAIFLFVKRGYRRLAEDTDRVVASGFQWMDMDGRLHDQPAPAESSGHLSPLVSEIPDVAQPVLPVRAVRRSTAGHLTTASMLPFFTVASLLRDIGNALRTLARDLANFRRDVSRFRRMYQELSKMLAQLHPSLLIVGQDTIASELSFVLIAAGRLGIPRLITPFAMFPVQGAAEYALSRPSHHAGSGALNRLVDKVYPHWSLDFRGHILLRHPGYRALALEMTGLTKGLPWSSLTEPVEAITASSEVAADALVALGVRRSTLHVTGSPVHDRLASMLAARAELRARLCQEYCLNPEKPLVVCGWPVNMFPWLAGRQVGYMDYSFVASAWTKILVEVRNRHGVNVIVSVHPKTLPSEIAPAEKAGLPCRRTGADELIVAADIFTTLNGSSITAWAIACGVPVVLFDCFLTRYPDFLSVPGCLNVETEDAFSAALHALCQDGEAREVLANRQRNVSAHWGKLDGQAGARLAELVRELVADKTP